MVKIHKEYINIKKASTHNLKDVSLKIPQRSITVVTGLSGSGKSSLAFDTIFAEGQRRYVESLSTYARQFLHQLKKPEVEEITGLSPSISIDQKSRSNNPRSTIATITEIYDYLRVLFARIGKVNCVVCGRTIKKHSKEEIIKEIEKSIIRNNWLEKNKKVLNIPFNDRKIKITAPVVVGRKGEYYQLLYDYLGKGFESIILDGKEKSLRNKINLEKNKKHDIEIVVDEIYISDISNKKEFLERLSESVERALHEANGVVKIYYPDDISKLFSIKFFCPYDGFSFPEVEPRLFSFNSPYGACEECNGLGTEDIFSTETCKACNGDRLRKEALSVYLENGKNLKNIMDVTRLTVEEAFDFFTKFKLTKKEEEIAGQLINEIANRLNFMVDVGLEYLTLDRKASTLSGGEAQRIRLASQLGSGLVGTLYVLDEPTIGLHQSDNERLVKTLLHLRDLGNTIIVVEHDEDTIMSADYLVDIGPGAGAYGGEVVVADYLKKLLTAKSNTSKSLTLSYLRGESYIEMPSKRRANSVGRLSLKKVTANNIKNEDFEVPLNKFVTITGVSGSGKSTFLHDVLYRNLVAKLDRRKTVKDVFSVKEFKGYENLSRVIFVDQSPIGRTPRSTPVTYIGAFNHIRDLFASTEDARYKGWAPGRFSFNVKNAGRCENCEGNGWLKIEMHFLPAVFVKCDTCNGKRYSKETLDVQYKGKNIYEVLNMSVEEALKFFDDIPSIYDRLKTLDEVGLAYLKLGQPSSTLSGGEAQRIKIASELYRPNTRKTIYLLDEPTVGLHYEDVKKLIGILNKLVDRGNTVVLIEHNLDVIKSSDYLIDIGPGGGLGGGKIVAKGTPEQVVNNKNSITGKFLKKYLKRK